MSGKLDTYDSGLLNDWGGGNVGWWQDYIRVELGRAHEFYAAQIEAAEARERKLVEALRAAAQTIALVRKGIRQRAIKDVGMISTNMDAPSLDVQPLSAVLDNALVAASRALPPPTPAAPEMPADCHPQGE